MKSAPPVLVMEKIKIMRHKVMTGIVILRGEANNAVRVILPDGSPHHTKIVNLVLTVAL